MIKLINADQKISANQLNQLNQRSIQMNLNKSVQKVKANYNQTLVILKLLLSKRIVVM